MEIKTTMRYHFTLVRMASLINAGDCGEKGTILLLMAVCTGEVTMVGGGTEVP